MVARYALHNPLNEQPRVSRLHSKISTDEQPQTEKKTAHEEREAQGRDGAWSREGEGEDRGGQEEAAVEAAEDRVADHMTWASRASHDIKGSRKHRSFCQLSRYSLE